jgi:DNA invertase Pin-like site-specific DNA recombinase
MVSLSRSELVTRSHLQRKAVIYVRQSTPHQVLSNQESLRVQYALEQRARSLGWHPDDVEIIDTDLGVTGASAAHRAGFQELVAQVTLGQVGLILSCDVTRLSRNCSDWYPLLDVCGYRGCLIADSDGIYDPASPNGRLLLGLKGQLSELELHTLRARMTTGLLNKAQRGELALTLPVGLVRERTGRVRKDPHREVQDRLSLIFTTFLRVKSASKVLQFLNAHELGLPRRDRFGDILWKTPTVAAILAILKNPAYAGAFVYGRTRTVPRAMGAHSIRQTRPIRLPLEQWKIRVPDVYPAYVDWPTFERIQAMLQDNYAEYSRNQTHGVPRPGAALLHGLVYCGECGHKLVVQYKGGTRYLCNYLRQQYRVPVCQNIPGDAVDPVIVEAFFQALAPIELDVYAQAVAAQRATDDQIHQAHHHQLERLRYEAALAERQFLRADPDNRLVAAELEKRWEAALSTLQRAEAAAVCEEPPIVPLAALPDDLKAQFTAIGQHLPDLWRQGRIAPQHQTALLRCLIDKVVVHRPTREFVQARIVWKGGATTSLAIPVPVGALADLAGRPEMERMILERSRAGVGDEAIACELSTLGFRSPLRRFVLPSTVKIVRLRHRVFQKRCQSHPRHLAGWLTVPQIARALNLSPHWLYDRIHNGRIQLTKNTQTGLFLFPDAPSTLERLRLLKEGTLDRVGFGEEYQHA